MITYEPWQIAAIALIPCSLVIWLMIRFFEVHSDAPIPPQKISNRSYAPAIRQESDRYDQPIDPNRGDSVVDPRWIDLFSILRRCAFAILAGATRSGKTVVAHNLIKARLADHQGAIIFDPDAQPGHWPGAMVYGAGDNWEHMRQGFALVNVLIEARRRYRANREIPDHHMAMLESAGLSVYGDDIVTIGLIDASDTMQECKEAPDILKTLARRGAKLGLHLLIDVQDTQVSTLNIGGASKVLINAKLTLTIKKDRAGARWCEVSGEESPTTERLKVPTLPAPDDGPRRSSRANISTGIRTGIDTGICADIGAINDALGGAVAINPSNTSNNTDSIDSGANDSASAIPEESDPASLIDTSDQSAKAQRIRKTLEKAQRGEALSNNDLAALMRMDRNMALEVINSVKKAELALIAENNQPD